MEIYRSLSIANPSPVTITLPQKLAVAIGCIGLFILLMSVFGVNFPNPLLYVSMSLILMAVGIVWFAFELYNNIPAGIKNNGVWFSTVTGRGVIGWVSGILITGFYIVLYFFPQYLGLGEERNSGLISLFDPLSYIIKKKPASQWFVYGSLYTFAILTMGVKFILKYRHNRYQVLRTASVMFFQLGFAFLIPEILQRLNHPYYNFANMWPLNYYFFFDWHIKDLTSSGVLGLFMLVFGLAMIFMISPVLTYFFGKRWYCSWVCGCGGLAETAGDPWRHLSDKSITAWKIERWVIHSVLVFSIVMTIAVLYSLFHQNPEGFLVTKQMFLVAVLLILVPFIVFALIKGASLGLRSKTLVKRLFFGIASVIIIALVVAYFTGSGNVFFVNSYTLRSAYGFWIGSIFSGVVGVGFYPILGSRVWCRFGCPMAAILGLQQRFFSRFRITTNGNQCISCGNCSTYCEMGIDVRHYAQRGQNIVRASCVGCGICSAVCPRGVLKLENGPVKNRTSEVRNFVFGEVLP